MPTKMHPSDLAAAVAAKTGQPKTYIRRVLDATCETILDAIKAGDSVALPKIGTLKTRTNAARQYNTPAGKVARPDTRTLKIAPTAALKEFFAQEAADQDSSGLI
jgi:nucleoid DNA-binding protein